MSTLLLSVQRDLDVIGLRGLHQFLLSRGEESTLVFLPQLDREADAALAALDRFVAERRPALAGVSLMSFEYARAARVTGMLRARHPRLPVVWGGIHPTSDPESSLDAAEWICIGEGEQTLLDLARAAREGRPFHGIPNIGWREGGKLRQNPPYPLLHDLDTLPPLARIPSSAFVALPEGVFPLDKALFARHARYRGRNYATISSRGCPYECAYCCNSLYHRLYPDWRVRRRSVGHLVGELEEVFRNHPEVAQVNFYDDCFLACPMEHLREFCAEYKARVNRPFIARTAPAYVTEERLALLKDAGLAWINAGLQSGSNRVCREVYCRRSTRAQFLDAACIIHRHRIPAFYDIIVDNPWESREETLETVEALLEVPRPFYAEIFSLAFYRGTPLRERAEAEGVPIHEDPKEKDFFILQRRLVNDLVEAAAHLPLALMRPLLRLYRRRPDSLRARAAVKAAKWACVFIFNPVAYFRLIRMSRNGSLAGTLAVLPDYLATAFAKYYLAMFRRGRSGH